MKKKGKKNKKDGTEVLKSEGSQFIFLMGTFLFGLMTYGTYEDIEGTISEDKMMLLLIVFGIGVTLYSLYLFLNPTQYEFSKEGIIVKNKIETKKYAKENILGFREELGEGRSSNPDLIIIKTNEGYLRLASNYFSNFPAMSEAIHLHYKKLSKSQIGNYKFQENWAIRFVIALISLGTLGFSIFLLTNNVQITEDLVWIQGELELAPISKSEGNGRDDLLIMFKLKEHPEFRFLAKGPSYRKCSKAVLTDLKRGSEVELGLLISDYESKILKKHGSSEEVNSLDWKDIIVYHIGDKTGVYLAMENIKGTMEGDRQVGWFFLAFSILCAMLFIYSIKIGFNSFA